MQKKDHFSIILRILLTLLLLLALGAGLMLRQRAPEECFRFRFPVEGGSRILCPWADEAGVLHVFLPSCTELSVLEPEVRYGTVRLEGVPLEQVELSTLTPEQPCHVTCGGRKTQLVFHQASNVASLYVDTAQGGMERIYAEKTHKEKVNIGIYSPEGEELYRGKHYNDQLRGRGNSTWLFSKKPFNVYLNKAADLLGNGEAKEWVLLANMIDRSNVRDNVVYDLARDTGAVWSPDTEFVDVYLNGVYAGLYLLSDKIEVQKNRLVLEPEDVLIELEMTERTSEYRVTDVLNNLSAEICYPKNLNEQELSELEDRLRGIFDGISEQTIPPEELGNYIDLDSWAWLYLIQEISENYDAAHYNLFFYLRDGKLYAGPVWDYDDVFGVEEIFPPESFYARDRVYGPLWRDLLKYEEFGAIMREKYSADFAERLEDLLHRQIPERTARIDPSAQMNIIRWNNYAGTEEVLYAESTTDKMLTFLERRIAFLNHAWIDGAEYVTVSARLTDCDPIPIAVEKGQPLGHTLDYLQEYFGCTLEWFYREDGLPVDFSAPVTQNVVIRAELPAPEEEQVQPLTMEQKLLHFAEQRLPMASIACFGLLLVLMLMREYRLNGRRRTDG